MKTPGEARVDGVGQADRLPQVVTLDPLRFAEEFRVHGWYTCIAGGDERPQAAYGLYRFLLRWLLMKEVIQLSEDERGQDEDPGCPEGHRSRLDAARRGD